MICLLYAGTIEKSITWFCKFSPEVKDFPLITTRVIVWKHENTIMVMVSQAIVHFILINRVIEGIKDVFFGGNPQTESLNISME